MEHGNDEFFSFMVENGFKIDAPYSYIDNPTLDTALHESVKCDNIHLSKYLIKHGASPLIQNEIGKTPLDYAREKENEEMTELLKNSL